MIPLILLQAQATAKTTSKAAQEFGQMDPYGVIMMIIAMGVVFIGLILLYLTFKYISRLYTLDIRKKFRQEKPGGSPVVSDEHIPADVTVAIALALHLYRSQLHDAEDPVITIRNIAKRYSPWSSKIYGLRKSPK